MTFAENPQLNKSEGKAEQVLGHVTKTGVKGQRVKIHRALHFRIKKKSSPAVTCTR